MAIVRVLAVLMTGAALLLTACGSSSAAGSASPTPSTTSTASASPVALDPCVLVTAAEASALAGVTFAAGTEGTTDSGGGKTCTYGAGTTNVLTVLVAQAPDAATAQADWAQEQAKGQAALQKALPAGVAANLAVVDASVAGADKAAVATMSATISGVMVAITAIYVLKGATFLYTGDITVGKASPTPAAMEAQAGTSLSRIA